MGLALGHTMSPLVIHTDKSYRLPAMHQAQLLSLENQGREGVEVCQSALLLSHTYAHTETYRYRHTHMNIHAHTHNTHHLPHSLIFLLSDPLFLY